MELTKLFSDGNGNFENVEFIMQNDSDGYYVKAELNVEEGIYYVAGHVADEKDATHFVPVIPQPTPHAGESEYKVIFKGPEDDVNAITEFRTDDGYTLLMDNMLEDDGSVNAGHRGWGGASYFRYIDQMQPGDEVIITNLWEVRDPDHSTQRSRQDPDPARSGTDYLADLPPICVRRRAEISGNMRKDTL